MPAVLVHGVPETSAIWNSLLAHLNRSDVITLQLPGFGCARPKGFGATKEEYVDWLIGELEAIQDQGPVDLVGHDWGGGLVVRLVSLRPDLVHTWITDAAGFGNEHFEWHEFAKIWQTPGAGEEFFATQLALSRDERAGVFEIFGVPHDEAMKMDTLDQTMADAILDLYRSAVTVGQEWGPAFHDIPAPGVAIIAVDDAFLTEDRARGAAARAGATVVELPGVGHWWMAQDPAAGASTLEKAWALLS